MVEAFAELEVLPEYDGTLYIHGGTRLREFTAKTVLANKELSGLAWAEFGVMQGFSAHFFSHYLEPDGRFYLFDSWEGLPEPWIQSREKTIYAYAIPARSYSSNPPIFNDPRLITVKGWYEDTLPKPDMGDLAFVHIDCDLYSSTKTVLERCNEQIVPGTIILFDELWGYQCWREGEYKALQEWKRKWRFLARDTDHRAVIEVL